jgi:hypothetical protein
MSRILLFSLTAMLNPTLLAVATVMLLLPNPRRLMGGYLAGAMLVSISLGLVVVFALEDSVASTGKNTVNPAADFTLGGLLLLIALVLATDRDARLRERRRRRQESNANKPPARWQRALAGGSPRVAFCVGIALTLPGASYLAALTTLDKENYATVPTILVIVLINVIMLGIIEAALLGFIFAPDWTPRTIDRGKAWFGRHSRRVLIAGTGGLGTLLILRGVITLLSA